VSNLQDGVYSDNRPRRDLGEDGAVRIETSDTELLEAVHEVLRYQITEYHTDDPLDVNR